jgi:hypothetical protein
VIANAGLLTRGALTVNGTGAVLDLGATVQTVSAFQLGAGTVEWKFDGEQFWVGVWVGECGVGRDSDADQEH